MDLDTPPLISFIVPTTGRDSLSDSMLSIINQTDPSWEAYVIGDALNTWPDRLPQDTRIQYVNILHKKGHSESGNQAGEVRNVGLNCITTPWVGFLDDDDTLTPDYIFHLKKYSSFDLVIFRMRYSDGRILPGDNRIAPGCVGISFSVRTSFLEDRSIRFKNSAFEDWEFISACIRAGAKYIIAKQVTYLVRPA